MGLARLLGGMPNGPTVPVEAVPTPPPHRYCLRCDVPFTSGPCCPGCGGPGIADRDPLDDQAAGDPDEG